MREKAREKKERRNHTLQRAVHLHGTFCFKRTILQSYLARMKVTTKRLKGLYTIRGNILNKRHLPCRAAQARLQKRVSSAITKEDLVEIKKLTIKPSLYLEIARYKLRIRKLEPSGKLTDWPIFAKSYVVYATKELMSSLTHCYINFTRADQEKKKKYDSKQIAIFMQWHTLLAQIVNYMTSNCPSLQSDYNKDKKIYIYDAENKEQLDYKLVIALKKSRLTGWSITHLRGFDLERIKTLDCTEYAFTNSNCWSQIDY